MAAILKIYFALLLLNGKTSWLETWQEVSWQLRSKVAKIILEVFRQLTLLYRLKVAKILPFGNPSWPPSWKSILHLSFWPKRPIDLKLGRKYQGNRRLVYQKKLKLLWSEIQDGHHGCHFESPFCASLEPKGKLTQNLAGSIGAT